MSVSWRKDREPVDELERAMLDDGIIQPGESPDWSHDYLREDLIDWRAVGIGVAISIVGGVIVAGASLLLTGAVFGLNPVELAADIRSVLR